MTSLSDLLTHETIALAPGGSGDGSTPERALAAKISPPRGAPTPPPPPTD